MVAIFALSACSRVDDTRALLRVPAPLEDGGLIGADSGPSVSPDASLPDTGPGPQDAGPIGKDDGEACLGPAECAGGACFRSPTWRGGYCSLNPCDSDLDCTRPDGHCVQFEPNTEPLCAARCTSDTECRDGYSCQPRGAGRQVCLPEPMTPALDLQDGEACTRSQDCRGGRCLTGPQWPDGYCTTFNCGSRFDCASHMGANNECAPDFGDVGAESWCARTCRTFAECRAGYACVPVDGTLGLCLPDVLPTITPSPQQTTAIGAQCGLRSTGDSLSIDYEVAPNRSSYMVTVFSRDGRYIVPERIDGPAGRIDFRGANAFQARTTLLHGSVVPILIPQIPQLASQVGAGAHRFELSTRSQDVCWYLFEEATAGATLDLNIYLVGTPRITAANARQNGDLQAVLTVLDSRLSQAGVSLGDVRYYDASPADIRRFSVLRSDSEFLELMTRSQLPGPTRDEALSLNLFFVRSIMFPDGSPLGIASALPGPAGVHGTRASGVVSTSEYFGARFEDPQTGANVEGSDYTGLILAHEIGHYLGLFHTSEISGEDYDPILDTPECAPSDFPERCPDLGNLMFPYAFPQNINLSAGQLHTVRANPLSKD